MEPPRPPFRCHPKSEAAVVALGHLQGVEKQLQNEGFDFSKETIQHLEDAIKAVKDLELERKQTFELWEEETIKNCSLRIKVRGLPELVMKEFEELVSAARRHRFMKLNEIETSIKEINSATEEVQSKQHLSEEQNAALCKEQAELWDTHRQDVQLLNEQMAEKHALNIEINELHNQKKYEEEEITHEKTAIEELKKTMSREAAEFRANKDQLNRQISELRRKLAAKERETEEKRSEYLHLLDILKGLEKEIADYNEIVNNQKNKLSEIFKNIRKLIKELEEKKAKKESILKKKAEVCAQVTRMDSDFEEDKENLLRQLKEAEEQLEAVKRENERLTNENNLLSTQFQSLTAQEDDLCSQRDHLAQEFERLSNMLTEKLDLVAKRLVETKHLEEELDRLQEIYQATESNYIREIANLEVALHKEGDKRAELQNQLVEITEKCQKIIAEHEEFLEKSAQKSEAGKKILVDLTSQNEKLQKEILKAAEIIQLLTNKLRKKGAYFKKLNTNLETEIKNLQDNYDEITKLLQEKEEELKVNIPLSEKLKMELEEMTISYESQKELLQVLREQETALKKSLERSIRETAKFKRQKVTI
uniref:Coiled-coil domain-containing protein 175 n=1 Tax=Salvator merianae TaxID=96440 RepID=A0A8D0C0K3_SALMN